MGLLRTVLKPFSRPAVEVPDPTIGFLNLQAAAGEPVAAQDRSVLAPLFARAKSSSGIVPHCPVLFIYADIDVSGRIVGTPLGLAEIVNNSAANVIVFASGNTRASYDEACKQPRTRRVNMVFTLDRTGRSFAPFFVKLFTEMYHGTSMLAAWARLAPENPGASGGHVGRPSMFVTPEAGHVTFRNSMAEG
jgi:hypothetical protein